MVKSESRGVKSCGKSLQSTRRVRAKEKPENFLDARGTSVYFWERALTEEAAILSIERRQGMAPRIIQRTYDSGTPSLSDLAFEMELESGALWLLPCFLISFDFLLKFSQGLVVCAQAGTSLR